MRQIEITSVKRLLAASFDLGLSTHTMEEQTRRTQERLNQGVDLEGGQFKPYKDPNRKHDNTRPLQRAAKLFDDAKYDVEKTSSDGLVLKMTIHGMAARIARYQNVMREFLGYAKSDRSSVRSEIKLMLSEAFRRWR